MKNQKGTCKFCKQMRIVQVPDKGEFSQEELDGIATDECECKQASHSRERKQKMERAELIIDNMPPEHEKQVATTMKAALPDLIDQKLRKLSISVDSEVSYTMSRGKDGEVKIRRQQIVVNEDETS